MDRCSSKIISNLQGADIAETTILLQRGGEQWLDYDKLNDALRNEWNAFESMLLRLATDKYLYIWGNLENCQHAECVFSDSPASKSHGICFVRNADELHRVLISDRCEYYYYIIRVSKYPMTQLQMIANIHEDEALRRYLRSNIRDLYLLLEEHIDRNRVTISCLQEVFPRISAICQLVLTEFGLL